MPRRIDLAAVAVACVALVAPAVASGASRADQRAAAQDYAARAGQLDAALQRADRRAQAAAAAVRKDNRGCASSWKGAPPQLREELGVLWFESVAGGLWSVDQPLYARWVRGVNASAAVGRSPVLRRQARRLRAELQTATTVYGAVDDACALVERWSSAGWSAQAAPRALEVIHDAQRAAPKPVAGVRRLLRRELTAAQAVRALAHLGIEEPDARVEAGGCDPIGGLLLDHYAGCGGH